MKKIIVLLTSILSISAYAGNIKSKSFDSNYAELHDQEQVEAMKKEIQALNSKVEKLEHVVLLIQQQLDNNGPSENRISEDYSAVENSHKQQIESKQPIEKTLPVAKGNEKQQYDIALSALKGNDTRLAAEKFAEFIKTYPKSQLVSNAYFWYGETFFKQKKYDRAALQYLKSYKQAPKGAKASDSLFKLATSLAELKKTVDACGMLNKLDNEFPSRPATSLQKAQNLRNQLKCK